MLSTMDKQKRSEIAAFRKQLPIFKYRSKLLSRIKENSTVVLVGETGCGKTTQLPQYLLEERLHYSKKRSRDSASSHCMIACTQPRRVAAMSVSQRVADEKESVLGELVGYSVRFDNRSSWKTHLKYLTDGMLLREAMLDPLLLKYSIIIIDEAHERTLSSDILLGVIKSAQQNRIKNKLKIIIMSATIDIELFKSYFSSTKSGVKSTAVIEIPGRLYPVEVLYTELSQPDYVDSVIITVLQIHIDKGQNADGDILVFLTGQEEIDACAELLSERSRNLPVHCAKLIVCPLYAALPSSEQMKVFDKTPKGCRKVVLSTNIAETSLTIDGIRYVVDPGRVKARMYRPQTGLESLQVIPASKAQCWQRCGRAGRISEGKCYRLFTEAQFEKLSDRTVPEIQRVNMSEVVLQLLVLGIQDVLKFEFIEAPSVASIKAAYFHLIAIGALDRTSMKLTASGKAMAELPVLPVYSKLLFESVALGCCKEALTITAMLSVEAPLYIPKKDSRNAKKAHKLFSSYHGDHLTLLNIYNQFQEMRQDKQWCRAHFVKVNTMIKAAKVRKQLQEVLMRNHTMKFNSNASCLPEIEPVLKCLVSAFNSQVARRLEKSERNSNGRLSGEYKTLNENQLVSIHPSSVLFNRNDRPSFVLYNELVLTSKQYLRGVTAIEQEWLVELAPQLYSQKLTIKAGGKTVEATKSNQLALKRNLMMNSARRK